MKMIWPNKARVKDQGETGGAHLNVHDVSIARCDMVLPIFFDHDGALVRTPTEYLYSKYIYSKLPDPFNTIRTYAEAILHWMKFCGSTNQSWEIISNNRIILYRNSMRGSGIKDLKSSTINLRITVLCDFWRHIQHDTPLDKSVKNDKGSKFKLRVTHKKPRTIEQAARTILRENLTGANRLAYAWTIATGMRIGSALSITHAEFLNFSARRNGFLNVYGKGGKRLEIYIPTEITEQTQRYITIERQLSIAKLHRGQPMPAKLFLNTEGLELTRATYYRAFKKALLNTGFDYSPHDTRSTFATQLKKNLDLSPVMTGLDSIKIVQGMLGHTDYRTTELYIENLTMAGADVTQILEGMTDGEL